MKIRTAVCFIVLLLTLPCIALAQTSPGVTLVSANPVAAKTGDTVAITFDTQGSISNLAVTVNGNACSEVTADQQVPARYGCTYTVLGSTYDPSGWAVIAVSGMDSNQNGVSWSFGRELIIDNNQPADFAPTITWANLDQMGRPIMGPLTEHSATRSQGVQANDPVSSFRPIISWMTTDSTSWMSHCEVSANEGEYTASGINQEAYRADDYEYSSGGTASDIASDNGVDGQCAVFGPSSSIEYHLFPAAGTIAFWLHPGPRGSGLNSGGNIIDYVGLNPTVSGLQLSVDSTGTLSLAMYDSDQLSWSDSISTPDPLEPGWHYIAVSYGSSGLGLYVDGTQVDVLPDCQVTPYPYTLYLGSFAPDNTPESFTGKLDCLKVSWIENDPDVIWPPTSFDYTYMDWSGGQDSFSIKAVDAAGNQRVSSFWVGPPATPVVDDHGPSTGTSSELIATWSSDGGLSTIAGYQWAIGTSPTFPFDGSDSDDNYVVPWQTTQYAIALANGLTLQDGQTYYFYVQAFDAVQDSADFGVASDVGVSEGITYNASSSSPPGTSNNVIFVNGATENNLGDGSSWENAVASVEVALYLAQQDPTKDEIWIAQGTYVPSEHHISSYQGSNVRPMPPDSASGGRPWLALTPGLKLYGGFAGTETQREQRDFHNWRGHETILDGTACNGPALDSESNETAVSVVDGFTIKGALGIKIIDSSIQVSNNRFSDCLTGVSVDSASSVSIFNNRFTGAVYGINTDNSNCSVYNNVVSSCGFTGINCGWNDSSHVSNNTVVYCRDGISGASGTTISNNIVAFQTGNGIVGADGSPPVLSHNCVFGNGTDAGLDYSGVSAGAGSISEDPLFADADYRLSPESLCIDAGENNKVQSDTDFDGNARIEPDDETGVVDMGAYEFSSETSGSISALSVYPRRAYVGDNVTVYFRCSAALQAAPTVTINGNSATQYSSSGSDYVYQYTVLPSDPDGWAAISVSGTNSENTSVSVTDSNLLWILKSMQISYASDGSGCSVVNSNGTSCVYTWDQRYRLREVKNKHSNGNSIPGALVDYSLDAVGNRVHAWLDGDAVSKDTAYEYDAINRLTSVAYPGESAISFTYDWVGNRLSAGMAAYVYDEANRLIDPLSGSLIYAPTGSLQQTSDGTGSRHYSYDLRELLTNVTDQ